MQNLKQPKLFLTAHGLTKSWNYFPERFDIYNVPGKLFWFRKVKFKDIRIWIPVKYAYLFRSIRSNEKTNRVDAACSVSQFTYVSHVCDITTFYLLFIKCSVLWIAVTVFKRKSFVPQSSLVHMHLYYFKIRVSKKRNKIGTTAFTTCTWNEKENCIGCEFPLSSSELMC